MMKNLQKKIREKWIDLKCLIKGPIWCFENMLKAIKNHNLPTVQDLARRGVGRREFGSLLITTAMGVGRPDIASELVRLGVSFCFSDFNSAIRYNRTQLITEMLKKKPEYLEIPSKDLGHTPLMIAVNLNALAVVEALMNVGANIHAKDHKRRSLLHLAVPHKNTYLVERFIRLGLDVNAQDAIGETPLYKAVAQGSAECILKLVELGADETIKNDRGWTPLDAADKKPAGFGTNRARDYLEGAFVVRAQKSKAALEAVIDAVPYTQREIPIQHALPSPRRKMKAAPL